MEQSATPARDKEESQFAEPPAAQQEQNVRFDSSPVQRHGEQQPLVSNVELKDFDEEEQDEAAFMEQLLEAQKRNQDHFSSTSVPSAEQQHPPLAASLDSMDSNDFVQLEKPQDLSSVPSHPEVDIHLLGKSDEITPSDDVAPPVGEDLKDFAPSPQEAAHDLAGRAHQTLEQLLSTAGEAALSAEREISSLMHHRPDTTTSGRRIAFDDEEEDTFRRQGPLTVGQPMPEIKQLQHDTNTGLLDGSESPTLVQQLKSAAQDAAGAVGEFASKISHEAQESAFKTKEMLEHGAEQTKETAEDLLGFEEATESPAQLDESPAGRYPSTDVPDTPVFLSSARPPTPPKPRADDAPEVPPVLDLGGPAHPHQYSPYQRKPSLKMSPATLGLTATGMVQGESAGVPKGPSMLDFSRWDKNVLDLIYWRDPKKSGIVFGVTLALLISLAVFNVITVGSYLGLLALAAAFGYRAYSAVMATVHKSDQKNPFQRYLKQDLDFPHDTVHQQTDVILKNVKDLLHHLRRLFLVEDLFETLKFAVLLWLLTYVGAYFSGTALIILMFVGLFTLPKVYELYQPQIDHYYGIAESKVKQASDVAREQLDKVPLFKKQKPMEKKE